MEIARLLRSSLNVRTNENTQSNDDDRNESQQEADQMENQSQQLNQDGRNNSTQLNQNGANSNEQQNQNGANSNDQLNQNGPNSNDQQDQHGNNSNNQQNDKGKNESNQTSQGGQNSNTQTSNGGDNKASQVNSGGDNKSVQKSKTGNNDLTQINNGGGSNYSEQDSENGDNSLDSKGADNIHAVQNAPNGKNSMNLESSKKGSGNAAASVVSNDMGGKKVMEGDLNVEKLKDGNEKVTDGDLAVTKSKDGKKAIMNGNSTNIESMDGIKKLLDGAMSTEMLKDSKMKAGNANNVAGKGSKLRRRTLDPEVLVSPSVAQRKLSPPASLISTGSSKGTIRRGDNVNFQQSTGTGNNVNLQQNSGGGSNVNVQQNQSGNQNADVSSQASISASASPPTSSVQIVPSVATDSNVVVSTPEAMKAMKSVESPIQHETPALTLSISTSIQTPSTFSTSFVSQKSTSLVSDAIPPTSSVSHLPNPTLISPSPDPRTPESGGWSTPMKVTLGLGVGAPVSVLFIVLIFLYVRRSKKGKMVEEPAMTDDFAITKPIDDSDTDSEAGISVVEIPVNVSKIYEFDDIDTRILEVSGDDRRVEVEGIAVELDGKGMGSNIDGEEMNEESLDENATSTATAMTRGEQL